MWKGDSKKKIYFFGYGQETDEEVMEAIIGHKPINGESAVLHGYKLGIQGVKNIPNIKVNGLPATARQKISDAWGKDFETYSAHKGNGKINGILWTIRKGDLLAIRYINLIDFKWYSLVKGMVELENGKKLSAWTLVIKNQKVLKEADGMSYDPFLGGGKTSKRAFLNHMEKIRRQMF
jgi:hypothetical protein